MTLDEAIKHAEEVAKANETYCELMPEYSSQECLCAEEHRQLAEWLKELKTIRENTPPSDDWEQYADRLHDIAYKSGYGRAMADIQVKIGVITRRIEDCAYEDSYNHGDGMVSIGIVKTLLKEYTK